MISSTHKQADYLSLLSASFGKADKISGPVLA